MGSGAEAPAGAAPPTSDAEPVRYTKQGGVARVTLDRPAVRNALDSRTHVLLRDAWADFEADDELRVAVLTGAGDLAFCAGQDLTERAGLDAMDAPQTTFGSRGRPGWPRLTDRFDLTKPVVARVNGHAIGGGLELVLACDIVVAADHAEFALPEVRLGLVAGAGGVFRLPRQLPLKVGMGHLLTGRRLTAHRAWELGLINEVVSLPELDNCVAGWVDDLLRAAPLSVRAIKQAAYRSLDLSMEEAFAATYPWEERRRTSRDAREGPRAFAERREPRWQGR